MSSAELSTKVTQLEKRILELEMLLGEMRASQHHSAYFQAVFNRTPLGMCVTDEKGNFVEANDAYCDFYGYTRKELLGKHFCLMVPDEHKEAMRQLHDDFIAGRSEAKGRFNVQKHDGSKATILADSIRIFDSDGRPQKVTFVSDITEALAAQRLREDIDKITQHDLKTPLQNVIAVPGIILENPNLTEEERELLATIEQSGRQMLSIINTSLALFRMESGQHEIEERLFDLRALLDRVMRDLRSQRGDLGSPIEVQVEGDLVNDDAPGPVLILGEEMLCYSLLLNPLKNALEASADSDEPIGIRIQQDREAVRIEIQNRQDVPEEIRDRFFEKNVSHGKRGGSGIGTYSARLIAEAHGGNVSLATGKGDGTTFLIELPARSPDLAR
jgi:PAS domain S-box-containing protein